MTSNSNKKQRCEYADVAEGDSDESPIRPELDEPAHILMVDLHSDNDETVMDALKELVDYSWEYCSDHGAMAILLLTWKKWSANEEIVKSLCECILYLTSKKPFDPPAFGRREGRGVGSEFRLKAPSRHVATKFCRKPIKEPEERDEQLQKNCQVFIDLGGLALVVTAIKSFPESIETVNSCIIVLADIFATDMEWHLDATTFPLEGIQLVLDAIQKFFFLDDESVPSDFEFEKACQFLSYLAKHSEEVNKALIDNGADTISAKLLQKAETQRNKAEIERNKRMTERNKACYDSNVRAYIAAFRDAGDKLEHAIENPYF